MLASFKNAIGACEDYLTVTLHSSRGNMPAQYDLLAAVYLARRDGVKNSAEYKQAINQRISGRKTTTPEKKRPYLLLLHALFGDELDQSMQRRLSKMTTALEQIGVEFKNRSVPTTEQLVDYIQSSGGIEGLWAKAKPVNRTSRPRYSNVKYRLTNIDGSMVKTPDGHALHLNIEPGEYLIHVKVNKTGQVKVKRTVKA
jgi:hypothetical protein